jgi:uncharacterized protein
MRNGRASARRVGGLLLVLGALAGVSLPSASARAGELYYYGQEGAYRVHLTTLKELKFRSVIRQQYDFSCGSAALATLLNFHYGIPAKETDVFVDMWRHGDQRKIRLEGFSMLDMQDYLARRSIPSNGYRSSLDRLVKAGVPGIVLLKVNGYLHFTIVEGVRDGRVLIADPALGTRAIAASDFAKAWNGVFFVILNHIDVGRKSFNREADWAVQPRAPVDLARNMQNLATLLLSTPGHNTMPQ